MRRRITLSIARRRFSINRRRHRRATISAPPLVTVAAMMLYLRGESRAWPLTERHASRDFAGGFGVTPLFRLQCRAAAIDDASLSATAWRCRGCDATPRTQRLLGDSLSEAPDASPHRLGHRLCVALVAIGVGRVALMADGAARARAPAGAAALGSLLGWPFRTGGVSHSMRFISAPILLRCCFDDGDCRHCRLLCYDCRLWLGCAES